MANIPLSAASVTSTPRGYSRKDRKTDLFCGAPFYLLARFKPATAGVRFRSLQQFFRWAEEEGEVDRSPMDKMRPPKVPEQLVPVLSDSALFALLETCKGNAFEDRRDNAIMRVMLDTGARLSEVAGLQHAPDDPEICDVDLQARSVRLRRKGGRVDIVWIGAKTGQAVLIADDEITSGRTATNLAGG